MPWSRGFIRSSAARRPVDEAEVGNLGDAAEFVQADGVEGREHRTEGVVHPYVQRPEGVLRRLSSSLHLVRVSDVGGDREGSPAGVADVLRRRIQPFIAPGEQCY